MIMATSPVTQYRVYSLRWLNEPLNIGQIKLPVTIGVHHPLILGRRESAHQSRPIPQIARMVHHPHMSVIGGQLVGNPGRTIGTTVIHHDYLILLKFE